MCMMRQPSGRNTTPLLGGNAATGEIGLDCRRQALRQATLVDAPTEQLGLDRVRQTPEFDQRRRYVGGGQYDKPGRTLRVVQ